MDFLVDFCSRFPVFFLMDFLVDFSTFLVAHSA